MSARNLNEMQSKMTLIKSSEYKKSLWKNGLGQTNEIAIYPPDSSLMNEDFLWRLSSAEVSANNQFSMFKNYDRLLTVLTGQGLVLNGEPLLPLQVLRFSGDAVTDCQIVNGPVKDLGLIFKRDQVFAKMSIKTFSLADLQHNLNLSEGTHLLMGVNGCFEVESLSVNAGDTLFVEGPFKANVILQKPATYIHIKICELKNKPAFCSLTTHD